MINKRILIPLLLILFMASMTAFGAPVYVNVGPTTEFDGDIKILSEIVAEGTTADGWETTIFFTDPTADRTITIPDFDVTVGTAIYLTVTDNEATAENNAILFTSGGDLDGGVLGIESDGDFYYNPSDGSVHATLLYGDGSNLTNVGAATATALTIDAKVNEAGGITKGQPVYFSGAVGQLPQASLADNTVDGKTCVAGIAAETKTDGQTILIRVGGQLDNLDTSAYSDGDCLYLSTAGSYSTTIPTSGAIIIVAGVEYDHASLGKLLLLINRTKDKGAPSGTDLIVRMGDNAAANKVIFKDYANVEVGFIDSDGKADFTSLTLDTALLIAEGGTNSAAALTNDRVMVSSGGAIIHSATITVTELGLLNGMVSVSTGAGDNDKLVTQGYVDDAVVGGGATTALDNLAAVAINTSLLSDTEDTDSLGSATKEWLNLYIGQAGKIYLRLDQSVNLQATGAGTLTITATTVVIGGTLSMGANGITTTGSIGRDADNYIAWDVDNTLKIEINNVLHSIVSISDGAGDNDKLVTQGYVDDIVGGANVSLSNLAAVAINTSLISDAADTDDLGSATNEWLNLYLGTYGTVYFGTGQTENIAETAVNELTITATTVVIGGTLSMGANGITTTGSIGVTGSRVTKVWTAALESTADITINGTALAAIYANLGANTDITSILNAALYIGRDADNTISFITDDKIIFKTAGVANMEILSTGEVDFNAFSAVFTEAVLTSGAAIAWDLGNSNKATLTAAHNFTITITAPSGAMNAQLIITQDGTGSRVMDEIVTQTDIAIATTDVHADTEIIDLVVDIPTGARIRFKTSAADLPDPLVVDTIYWAIRTSENHIQVATTKALAIAGTAVNITDQGSGTHTVQQLVKWTSGTLGVLSTAAGSEDILSLTYKTGDKQWYTVLNNNFY